MKTSRAFTLIELLIVISILGILMSLLFPAVNAAIDTARKTQAKNDVTQIATAVIAYETEYGKLPLADTHNPGVVDKALVDVLTGVSGNPDNPREIVFLEVNKAKRGKSGVDGSDNFVDPWAILENDTSAYKIAMDDDYNNTISSAGSSTHGTTVSNLRKKVAVWNEPKGKNVAQQKRRAVTSWD